MPATTVRTSTTPSARATRLPVAQVHASAPPRASHHTGNAAEVSAAGSAAKGLNGCAPTSHSGFHANCAVTTSKPSASVWVWRDEPKTSQIADRFPGSAVSCWRIVGTQQTTTTIDAATTGTYPTWVFS